MQTFCIVCNCGDFKKSKMLRYIVECKEHQEKCKRPGSCPYPDCEEFELGQLT